MLKRFLHHVETSLPAYFQWCFDTAAGERGVAAFVRGIRVCVAVGCVCMQPVASAWSLLHQKLRQFTLA